MKYLGLGILILIILISVFTLTEREEFGGHHGHRGRHGGGRRWGRRWGLHRPPPPPQQYMWYSPWNWFRGVCKDGCTSIGNRRWGCQYPGSGPNDCWFASDCYGCG